MVSDDPRCRLSLDDRALCGLVRDTIARVHGTFGAAACSIGFAGARVLGNPVVLGTSKGSGRPWRDWGLEEGERKGTNDPRELPSLMNHPSLYDVVLFRRLGSRAPVLDQSKVRQRAKSGRQRNCG